MSNHSRLKLSSEAIRQVELTAPKEVLLERVERDYRKGRKLPTTHERDAARRYYEARVDFINGVHID